MNFVALKMLVGDRLKYLGLVVGIAFASLLITQQASIFTGYTLRMGAWIRDNAHADLWIVDPQMEFSDDSKPLVDTMLPRVRGVEGVAWATPLYKGMLRARLSDGRVTNVRLVGLDDASLAGGPPAMAEGTLESLRADRAVLINAKHAGTLLALGDGAGGDRPMRVGDTLDINDSECVVAGMYTASDEFFWEPVVYTTYSRALRIAPRERKTMSMILVKAEPGADLGALQDRIAAETGLRALTTGQFDALTSWYILTKTGILVNFGITVALGVVIGVLVSSQLLYNFVLDHLRFFATLKAMGVTHARLGRMVLVQVAVAGVTGFGVGLGLAALTGSAFRMGGLAFAMLWQIPVFGVAAVGSCCALAALVSLWRVFRLEPGMVFKS